MTEQNELLEQLENLLRMKKGKNFYAERLNVSVDEIEQLLAEIRIKNKKESLEGELEEYVTGFFEEMKKVNNDKGTLESSVVSSFDPKNDEELAELHKVDLTKYKISSYWSKQRADKFTSSILCTLRKSNEFNEEEFSKFLLLYNPKIPSIYTKREDTGKELVDVELSIADFHLGKKTLDNETLSSRKDLFLKALDYLVQKTASTHKIGKIVFPISNDFFHTDNYSNSTTNLTQQDVLTSYDNEYEEGFDILVTAIYILRSFSEEVEVILVQGNHDRTKSFYVAHALEIQFKNDANITFKREHSVTKSTVLGSTFIGYHHGNSTKIDDLPLLFATGKDSSDFGDAKYREIHTGDKHHYMAKEIKGVRIQQMPSLSGVDRWHLDNNFVNNVRAALILIYHPENGKIGEYEYRVQK